MEFSVPILSRWVSRLTKRNIFASVSRSTVHTGSASSKEEIEHESDVRVHEDIPKAPLYPGHIPTTLAQKVLISVGSALAAITDPFRDDMVAVFGETTGTLAFRELHKIMSNDPEGRQILRDRPRIHTSTLDLDYLRQLPEETFGHAYYRFLADNNVTPDSRLAVQFVDDPELAYVAQRYREVHDLIHTLLEMPTHMLGEVTVKWVEAIHTKMPMCSTGALFGAVRLRPKQRRDYVSSHLPWALRVGYNAKNLMCVYYEKHWEMPLLELQHSLNIEPFPRKQSMQDHMPSLQKSGLVA
uniref:Ubiquinone biosynthesis protein COQ4 homolog, mitochondrial n=1 Tax=Ixodes ricinus TaxID=34613 RepID=A0A0K8RET9_IXORI